jgi:hypothetical protein
MPTLAARPHSRQHFWNCSRNAVFDCSARFARSARIAPWSPPTSSSLADVRRVCSFLLTAAGRDAVFDCSARFARSARIAPWSPPTSSSLADVRRVCSFLLTAAGRAIRRCSSATFETTLGGRTIWGVTVTPWLALSAVGRCSSSAAAARPSRAGILAAESDALPVRSPSSSEESCQTPLRPAPR